MASQKKLPPFPDPKQDRRHLARKRPDFSDRRSFTRYHCEFPVRVIGGKGDQERVYRAVARDISGGGLFIEGLYLPEEQDRVRLEFRIPDGSMPEEFLQGRYRLDAEVRSRDPKIGKVGVKFSQDLVKRLGKAAWYYMRVGAVAALVLCLSLVAFIKWENVYFFWFDVPIFLYSLAVGFYLVSRFIFSFFYRPPRAQPDGDLPSVSVVVPVFNEENHIERTLVCALECVYPADKIEIIAVNDGSSDNTLEVMRRMNERYPELIVVDLARNVGKRQALATGARLSVGEIVVFIDSDSFLRPDAIRNLVDSFADPKVAAVCGHCEVENKWTSFLTRIQAVRYFVSFRIMKAAESIFDTVTCMSGPLSAYRRSLLMEVVDDWVGQTFLGKKATFGDDRSMTNFLLKGHKMIYDSRARTATVVPEEYGEFFRQQMRWKRSWFRESMRASRIVWRREPLMSLSFYLGVILPILSPAIVFRALLYEPLVNNLLPLTYIMGIVLMSMLMSSTYLFIKRSRLWFYGIPFCFFYMLLLVWQMPIAIATFWYTKWGTRG
jgi:hyaluronan synthase